MYKLGWAFAGVIIFLFTFAGASLAQYSGGSGTQQEPYQISSAADWLSLINTSADWDKHFILTADINLEAVALLPVGSSSTHFTGVFDGNDHIIHNADVNMPSSNFVGLFGYVGSTGRIHNLGLEDVAITGEDCAGGLVGANEGSLTGCYTSGSVNGTEDSDNIGGLVGWNHGSSTDCYTTCSVKGIEECDNMGGLVGFNSGSVTDCYAIGSINGSGWDCDRVGGLVGVNEGSLAGCYSTGSVRGSSRVGGLVGWNQAGSITACYATGSVEGEICVGGLVGVSLASIVDCYSTGQVKGVGIFGGLIGDNHGTVTASFWDVETSDCNFSAGGEGKTTAQMKDINTFLDAGWNFDTVWWMPPGNYPRLICQRLYSGGSGTQENPYILKAVADWQKLMNAPGDWDKHFILTANIDLQGVALSPVGNWIRPFTGVFDGKGRILRNADVNMPSSFCVGLFGYVSGNAQIRNLGVRDVTITGNNLVGGIVGWNERDMDGCYATGSVVGSDSVGGLVGCNAGSITGCYSTCSLNRIEESAYIGGLVGWNTGSVTNCYATGSINTSDDCDSVGGLVGENSGNLTDCYATGSVSGNGYVGGLVGHSDEDCNLTACYATGPVKGTGYCIGGLVGLNHSNLSACYATGPVDGDEVVGGLVGSNGEDGSITDCYSTGSVSGISHIGGLAGYNGEHSIITNCYATGLVDGNEVVGGLVASKDEEGSTTASFWDVETTGQNTSIGGTGKTTAEMKKISTFASAGWDFIEIWDIGENQTYPYLRTDPSGDLNHDQSVNLIDLAILASQWLD